MPVKVYPTHENALSIRHPVSGPLSDEGSVWELDAFTARMIGDNAVTTDPAAAHKSSRPKIDPAQPPAHATGGSEVVQPVAAPLVIDESPKAK